MTVLGETFYFLHTWCRANRHRLFTERCQQFAGDREYHDIRLNRNAGVG